MEIFDQKVSIQPKSNIKQLIMYRQLTPKSNHKQMCHNSDSKLAKANMIQQQRMKNKKRFITNVSTVRNRSFIPQQSQGKAKHRHQIEQQELDQINNKISSKKYLWDMFQKYCNELKDLKHLFDVKYSRLKIIEERINGLIIDDGQDYQLMSRMNDIELHVGFDLEDNNEKIKNDSSLSLNFQNINDIEDIQNQSNNRNNFRPSLAIIKTNKNVPYESNDLFEPIIDIKEEVCLALNLS